MSKSLNSSEINLTYGEETHSITEWAELKDIPVSSIRARYNKSLKESGWTTKQIIFGVAGANLDTMAETGKVAPGQPVPKKVGNLMSNIQNYIAESIAAISVESMYEEIAPQIKQKLIDELGFEPIVHKVITGAAHSSFCGVTHEAFDDVLQLVHNNVPVFLKGEAGTGKSELCRQVADSLGLKFYFTNSVSQEYKISGFIDAYGKYHETEFFKAFTEGGLFFIDELDASIPEILVLLNAALANRYFDFPGHGRLNAHEDFRIIAAANTFGTGADENYTGRYSLDRASLDRFALIEIGYSPAIELASSNNNQELCDFARAFRSAANTASISCLFSYRSISRIATMESIFTDLPKILKISLLKGLEVDDINIIIGNIAKTSLPDSNKYYQALKSCV